LLSRGLKPRALLSKFQSGTPLRYSTPAFEKRTLTGKREKVKVLLVLYDGKKHAEEVSSSPPFPPQLMVEDEADGNRSPNF
jgi:hypothetical protein